MSVFNQYEYVVVLLFVLKHVLVCVYFHRNPILASPALKEIASAFHRRVELKLENVALLSFKNIFYFSFESEIRIRS